MIQPIISICIPSSGRIEFLEKTLDTIFAQNIDSSFFEVCISDNSINDETRNLLDNKYEEHKNLIYQRSNEHSYLNLIEALKMGNGKFLKLLNDYTSLINNNTLGYVIDFVKKYENDNAVLFFRSQEKVNDIQEFNDLNSFHKELGYWDTSAPCFGIYKTVFDQIIKNGVSLNKWFPHVSLLYAQKKASKFVVIDKKIFEGTTIKNKGGYNIPEVFGNNYIGMNEYLLKSDTITQDTYNFVKMETLDFVSEWYSKSIYDKLYCAFDFANTEKWLSEYYNKKEIKEFNRMVRKKNLKNLLHKVFWLPFFIAQHIRNIKRTGNI